jgi:aspartate carbamoyltransferase catalytic subunit
MSLESKSIISTRDLKKQDVDEILAVSDKMLECLKNKEKLDLLGGKILATLFFEPSTRTMLSFTSAIQRLGGSAIGFSSVEGTSIQKGETLVDTAKNVEKYSDCIVVRHSAEGSARLISENVKIPVINAGDGSNQHPTQALLDLFTIKKELGLGKIKVALCGDLKYGRTAGSLSHLLAMFGVEMFFVSPEQLKMSDHVIETLKRDYGIVPGYHSSLKEVIPEVDVLYVTRIQRERLPDPNEYKKIAGSYIVDKDLLKNAKKNMIVMHPLPRVDEIKVDVDSTVHAKYFDQAWYGVAVRMALLSLVFGKKLN